ncbi:class I SAM-dependent methyltransferase [Solwaraspora sp. WMMB335]|uniref:class I SAM-dependent methyltransferase n=1 Tax=Solwaraspora sp. WMMB335 TaxID=3404118 RepID=UPI003B940140
MTLDASVQLGDPDPHAQALWDFARSHHREPFHYVRSDGHAASYDISRRFGAIDGFSPQDAHITGAASGRTLDVGCGAGKHVAALHDRGVAAVGIDIAPLAVAAARHTGVRDVALMDAFRLGLRTGAFDCVMLYSNGLSIGGSVGGVRRLLDELARVTRPGGRLLMTNTDVTASPYEHDQAYQQANLVVGRPRGLVRMRCRYGDREGPWFDWLFVAPDDLPELTRRTAWRVGPIQQFPAGAYAATLDRM